MNAMYSDGGRKRTHGSPADYLCISRLVNQLFSKFAIWQILADLREQVRRMAGNDLQSLVQSRICDFDLENICFL